MLNYYSMTPLRLLFKRCAVLSGAVLLLFLAGCGLFKSYGEMLAIRLSSNVKMRFIYIAPLKIYVGRYEVSNREFRCFRPEHSSGDHQGLNLNGNDQPVVNVSWNDARAFCDWLNANHGVGAGKKLKFRLPSEKEWETYATCGSQSEFPWGAWPPPKNYNYYGRENRGSGQMLNSADGHRVSCSVKKSGENLWGLCGTGGNVWEWCEDLEDAQSSSHVLKGASWSDCAPLFLRTTRRSSNPADYKFVNIGFRVVAESSEAPAAGKNVPAR